ncbi:rod-binding protein [Planctomicrobium sp. SH664]|uniref:rod-binding protein n=1 Tax=Planctomicrobium sp. SH664 TaxID=3448125 RepID=UPI003F5B072E
MNGISLNTPMLPMMSDPAATGTEFRNADPKQLATEFESVFVSMLLKQMRESSTMGGEGEGLFPGDSADTYGGMFDMYLGRHIAQAGGIGLAESFSGSLQ